MKCKKDKSRTCGAGWRNSVFVLPEQPKVVAKVVAYAPLVGEAVEGCYKDSGNRDLKKRLGNGGDPKKCFELAMQSGYKYAGL